MKKLLILLIIVVQFLFPPSALGQALTPPKQPQHRFAVFLAHAHPTEWINATTGKRERKVLPAWAVDYDYIINKKWSFGLHTDVVIESFEVETFENKTIEREFPLALSLITTRKFGHHLGLQFGPGIEYEAHGSFALFRVGLDYGWEIRNDVELNLVCNYDYKIKGYQTYLLGFGVSKLW